MHIAPSHLHAADVRLSTYHRPVRPPSAEAAKNAKIKQPAPTTQATKTGKGKAADAAKTDDKHKHHPKVKDGHDSKVKHEHRPERKDEHDPKLKHKHHPKHEHEHDPKVKREHGPERKDEHQPKVKDDDHHPKVKHEPKGKGNPHGAHLHIRFNERLAGVNVHINFHKKLGEGTVESLVGTMQQQIDRLLASPELDDTARKPMDDLLAGFESAISTAVGVSSAGAVTSEEYAAAIEAAFAAFTAGLQKLFDGDRPESAPPKPPAGVPEYDVADRTSLTAYAALQYAGTSVIDTIA